MNGQRMKLSDAPTRRMISISFARLYTAIRIVLMIMNSTVSPTSPTTTIPTVRIVLMIPSSVSYSACLVMIRSTCSWSVEGVDNVARCVRIGQVDLEAGEELDVRATVSSSRPVGVGLPETFHRAGGRHVLDRFDARHRQDLLGQLPHDLAKDVPCRRAAR